MATFTLQHPELLDDREKEIFFKRYAMREEMYTKIARMRRSTKAYEQAMRVRGLGTFTLKPEGAPIGYTDPISGPVVRTVHSTYARGFRVTEEMLDDDQWDIIEKQPADLSDSAKDHRENLFWGSINNAFTTFTGLDGLSLINTAHTRLDGSATDSNQLSPGLALSVGALQAITTMAETTQTEEGRFTLIPQKWLVHHPNLSHKAKELLKSQFNPETSDNAINTVATTETGLMSFSVPYLADQDDWFVFADSENHSVTWFDRKDLTFDSSTDPATKDRLYDARYRAHVAARDWRGVWGSNVVA